VALRPAGRVLVGSRLGDDFRVEGFSQAQTAAQGLRLRTQLGIFDPLGCVTPAYVCVTPLASPVRLAYRSQAMCIHQVVGHR